MNLSKLVSEGRLLSAFVPQKKNFIISSIINGIVGSKNTDKTNRINYEINEMNNRTQKEIAERNNELSYAMFTEGNKFNAAEAQKNRDFQQQMFNSTNAYNSPEAQKQRLLAAGINPAIALGGSPAEAQAMSGNAASSEGVPGLAMPSTSAAHMDAFLPNFDFPDPLDKLEQIADIKKKKIDNRRAQFQADRDDLVFQQNMAEQVERIDQLKHGNANMQKEGEKLEEELFRLRATRNDDIEHAALENKQLAKAAELADQQIATEGKRQKQIDSEVEIAQAMQRLQEKIGASTIQLNQAQAGQAAAAAAHLKAMQKNVEQDTVNKKDQNKRDWINQSNTNKREYLARQIAQLQIDGMSRENAARAILLAYGVDDAQEAHASALNRMCRDVFGFGLDDIAKDINGFIKSTNK